eukprot:TRINITY_DN2762_c0_g1_i2.p1 TRINITY_DN2762_c0_g1~~TRINITY_DN2762_c0_g1_i2.p1  ORF type:complete len:131 (-),score=24.76 TRINITY_DN2762_c0_g1_i2:210-602(-)
MADVEISLNAVCECCFYVLSANEVLESPCTVAPSAQQTFINCPKCPGKVQATMVVQVGDFKLDYYEFYQPVQLFFLLSQKQEEEIQLPHLKSFEPDLLWSLWFHFGSYEEGMKRFRRLSQAPGIFNPSHL